MSSQKTANFNLHKWIGTDFVKRIEFNENFDAIDAGIQSLINNKVDKVAGKGLSSNDYTTTEKNKLAGIATGAQANQNAFSNIKVGTTTVAADSATDTLELVAGANITITPDATNDKITIVSTDTTYSVATNSVDGLLSKTDKAKLDGIAAGAQANQNAFSNVKVGATTIAADNVTDTLEIVAGSNITITPDATNDKVTIAATYTTYSAATTSADGLMSATDKTKLNGIATGAQANQNAFTNVKVGATTIVADSATDTLELVAGANITITPDATNDKITIASKDTTYGIATASADGLMSKTDKAAFDAHLADIAAHGTKSDITLYVSTTGNNANDGLTSGTALKTINAAIAKIPQIVNHNVTINILAGTYNESISLQGYIGSGTINVIGGSSINDSYVFNNIVVNRCFIPVVIRGIKLIGTNTHSFHASYSKFVILQFLKLVENSTYDGVHYTASNGRVYSCEISNKSAAIYADMTSSVYSESNNGTGNKYALASYSTSLIGKGGAQPTAITAEITGTAGEIRS